MPSAGWRGAGCIDARRKASVGVMMGIDPDNNDPLELEAAVEFAPVADVRPRIDPPPPVNLLAVADCRLPSIAGLEAAMDAFYVGILRFARDDADGLVYRAENFRVWFVIVEKPPEHADYRPLRVVVPSLAELIQQLIDVGVEFTDQRGLTPGGETILLHDPSGNLVEAGDSRGLVF